MKNSDLLLVLTTERDYKHAKLLAMELLRKKYAACISLRELNSLYLWEGDIEETQEVQMLIKTDQIHISNLFLEIKKRHSYELPELIYFPICSEEKYEMWIKEVLRSS